ncbi:MAG: DUF6773 family protein [Christensenella sp.]|nr:DUF6773 family protein [Christensenella sp.]
MQRVTDERQDFERSIIEHYALWTMFWLLVASIPVQLFFLHNPLYILGECAIVIIISLFILISFIKRALWGKYTAPSWKAHVLSGILTSVIGSSIIVTLYWGNDHILSYLFSSLIALFFIAFSLSYTLGLLVKKREQKLADLNDDGNSFQST